MSARKDTPRVAVVTGAAMGFGQAIAKRLAEDGHAIAIPDVASTAETEKLVKAAGSKVFAQRCDLTSPEDVASFAEAATAELGAPQIIVLNAGIYPFAPFLETTWERWRKILDINLDSQYHMLQALLPGAVELGWGRVISIASTTFHQGTPACSAYSASKGAIMGLIRTLATELGESGITANAIAPTLTSTPGAEAGPQRGMGLFDLVPQLQAIKRAGQPEDIVGTISFLASDDAAFVTGQTLPVDGGLVYV